jgi:hypothetical protein
MKKLFTYVATCMALLTAPPVLAKVTSSTVFSINENGSKFYRIPAITHNADGNLVAICDDRGSSSSDLGSNSNIKLVAKIGTQDAKGDWTWSERYTLPSPNYCYGDAAVVYDEAHKKIVCVFAAKYSFNSSKSSQAQIYVTTSEDGKTWTTPKEITSQFSENISKWVTGFVASGNMLYTKDGRIMAVINAKIRPGLTSLSDKAVEVVICSSDGGDNWSILNKDSYTSAPLSSDGNESKIAQLADGSYVMSIRTDGDQRFSFSNDGITWTEAAASNSTVTQSGANGDLINVGTSGVDYLLLSIPNNSSSYKNVSIFGSGDKGVHWNKLTTVCEGDSRYSSLIKIDDNSIGCFVEEGSESNGFNMNFYYFTKDEENEAEETEFDGSLACSGKNYLAVPAFDEMSVKANESITITARIKVNKTISGWFTRDLGVLSYRYYPDHSGLQYTDASGIEFTAGKSETETFGANITVDGSSGVSLGVLKNSYSDGVTLGEWAHVALTVNTSTGDVITYVNGVQFETQGSAKGELITMLGDLLIGNRYKWYLDGVTYKSRPSSDDILNGNIDDLRIYKDALTTDEIKEDMNSGFPLDSHALIAAYDFATYSYACFQDISGNGHTASAMLTDGDFPKTIHNISVKAKKPTGGSLHVQHYENGTRYALTYGDIYKASNNQDFYVFAEPHKHYKLVAIYVNGEEVDNGTYIKASKDMDIEAIFEHENENLDLYLVGNKIPTPLKFDGGSDGEYKLVYDGNLSGTFYVQEQAETTSTSAPRKATDIAPEVNKNDDTDNTSSEFYTYYGTTGTDYNSTSNHVVVVKGTEYNLEDVITDPVAAVDAETPILFSVCSDVDCTANHYIGNPTIVVTLSNNSKTLTIEDYKTTGVNNIAVDADSEEQLYNLQGIKVSKANLAPGIYIKRVGSTATKIHIN